MFSSATPLFQMSPEVCQRSFKEMLIGFVQIAAHVMAVKWQAILDLSMLISCIELKQDLLIVVLEYSILSDDCVLMSQPIRNNRMRTSFFSQ